MSDGLLIRIAQGDTSAVPLCLDRYGGLVWSLARRMVGSQAEDAVQEVFVDLWKSAGRFDPSQGTEATFVATLARRRIIDYLRRNARNQVAEPLPDTVLSKTSPVDTVLLRTEENDRVEKALGELRPEECRLIRLALQDGLTHEAIQTNTGLPLGTIKTHIRRGLLRLRDLLQERGSP
ncbi:MAG: RNA polymerase sigma factor [Fimbriiglobus sp.]